jgi:NTE family protein
MDSMALRQRLVDMFGLDRRPKIESPARRDDLAMVLDGGGARAAYQVGLLRSLARRHPDLRLPMLTGVSAGALNAVFLAAHPGPFVTAVDELANIWSSLTVDQVFRSDSASLAGNLWHWGVRLVGGGRTVAPPFRGLVDTAPLRRTLETVLQPDENGEIPGIARNLESNRLIGLAIVTSSYTTGRSVAWVQGRNIQDWERPFRISRQSRITTDHVMASTALTFLFPAVQLESAWCGDGGIRLVTPLSPAVHLGANRVLAFSTRYGRRRGGEAERPQVQGYPPPIQIADQLLSAIFLDDHDHDALTLARLNELLEELPPEKRHGLRLIDLVFIRPSEDIGRLAADYEVRLPFFLRHLLRSAGARQTTNPDLLSLLMFEPAYLTRLMEIGEADGEARADDVATLLQPSEET